jgi:tRNA threonylcarbamoyladenosine biosynthesis protein TsaE
MEEEDELISIGFEDYLKADGICLSEWSERFPDLLPPDAIRVSFLRTDAENGRSIEILGVEL